MEGEDCSQKGRHGKGRQIEDRCQAEGQELLGLGLVCRDGK